MAMKSTITIGGEIMKRTIIFAALLMIAASVTIISQTSDKKSDKNDKAKKEVIALVTEYNNALLKQDAAALERILADEYRGISQNGFPTNKTLTIRFSKETLPDDILQEAFNLDDDFTDVSIYGNTAVLVTKLDVKWRKGKEELVEKRKSIVPTGDSYIVTFIAVKKNGNWQIVLTHESIFDLKSQISKD